MTVQSHRISIYARVSSDQQADEATIERRYSRPNTGQEVMDQTTVIFESDDRIRMKPPGDRAEMWFFDRVTED